MRTRDRVVEATTRSVVRIVSLMVAVALTACATPGLPMAQSGGPDATDTTMFQAASITKAWTAAVVLQLVDEGRLQLDDPVARWFPAVPNAAVMTVAIVAMANDSDAPATAGLWRILQTVRAHRAR